MRRRRCKTRRKERGVSKGPTLLGMSFLKYISRSKDNYRATNISLKIFNQYKNIVQKILFITTLSMNRLKRVYCLNPSFCLQHLFSTTAVFT